MTAPQTPDLTQTEWSVVAAALAVAGRCGERRPAEPRSAAVRDFMCATKRHHRPAADLAPALAAHGFNAAQIDAIALLSL